MATAKVTTFVQLLACGNWKGRLQTTWMNKGQCHPQSSHMRNWLCAHLGSSLPALHRECHKTKQWCFLFLHMLLLLHHHPAILLHLSVSALLQGPASTLLIDGHNEDFRAAAAEHHHTGCLLHVLQGPRRRWKKGTELCKPAWLPVEYGGYLSSKQFSTFLWLEGPHTSTLVYMVLPVPPIVGSAMVFSFSSLTLPNFLVKQSHGTIISYPKSILQHC